MTTKTKTWNRYTDEQRAEVRKLREGGMSAPAIAVRTGIKLTTVYSWVADVGPSQRPEAKAERNAALMAARASGESFNSIGRRFGITSARVREIIAREEPRKALALATAAEAALSAPPQPPSAAPAKKRKKRRDPNAARRRARNRAIVAMAKAGELSRHEIAGRFGVSTATVWSILNAAGVKAYDPHAASLAERTAAANERDKLLAEAASTMTVAQLAKKFALQPATVRSYLSGMGVKPLGYQKRVDDRAERNAQMIEAAKTMTAGQIGRKFGLRPTTVKIYFSKAGVKARSRAELAAQAPVEIPAFLPPRERTTGTDAIGRRTLATAAGNTIVLDEIDPATKAPAAPIDLFKAYDLLKSAMPKSEVATAGDVIAVAEKPASAPVPAGAFLAEIEARHGTAEVLRRHPECDEGELLAALREGRKSVKAPVDDLPQPWLTRAGAAVSRFFGFGRS